MLGEYLEHEILLQLCQTPEQDFVLLHRQVVLAGVANGSVFHAGAAPLAWVRMSQDGCDEAAAGGDELQIPAQPVLVGRNELGLVEVRHDPLDGRHAPQGFFSCCVLAGAFPCGSEILHQADVVRLEDPGVCSNEVDTRVVYAAHCTPHLAQQVVIIAVGDRDGIQLLQRDAAVVGRPVFVRDFVPGVAELSVVDPQTVVQDGQHRASKLSLQGYLTIESAVALITAQ